MDSLHERRMKWIEKERARLQRNDMIFNMVAGGCMGYTLHNLLMYLYHYFGWL
jgi:hypothetical protein